MDAIQEAAARFAREDATAERLSILRRIMTDKNLKEFVRAPGFTDGLLALGRTASDVSKDADRLLAIDGMIRIWNSSVPATVATEIERQIAEALKSPLPPLSKLNDLQSAAVDKPAESRLNLAIALGLSNAAWIADYRIKSLIDEERAPNVRRELAQQILRQGATLETLLDELAEMIGRRGSTWQDHPKGANCSRCGSFRRLRWT
jgi:hypothetical protein